MPVSSNNTVFKFSWVSFREALEKEKDVRGVTYTDMALQTGVYSSTFTRLNNGKTVGADVLMSLCKWMNRNPFDFTVRKRSAYKHTDSVEQRQIRGMAAFVDRSGLRNPGESVQDAVIRLLSQAQGLGAFEE